MSRSTLAQPKQALKRTICAVLLVVFLVSSALLITAFKVSSAYILESTNSMKSDILSVYQQEIETIFALISQQVDLFLLNDDLWKIICSDADETDYVVIRNVLNAVKSRAFISNLVDSMYVFDMKHPFILADGFYRKTKFFDPVVLSQEFQASAPISQVRSVNGNNVFSLIYKPLIALDDNSIIIVVNISIARLETYLPFSITMGHFIMADGSNILYNTGSPLLSGKLLQAALTTPDQQNILRAEGQDYLVIHSKTDSFGICLYIFQDLQTVTYFKSILLGAALPFIILVLIGSILLVFILFSYLYRPMQQLVKSVSSAGYAQKAPSEYMLIDQAFSQLTTSRNEMEEKYRKTVQYSAKFMLQEFLINPVFNAEDFAAALQSLNIQFQGPMYTLFVFDLVAQDSTNLHHLVVPDSSVYGSLSNSISSFISETRLAVLVNHEGEGTVALRILHDNVQHWFINQGFSVYTAQSDAFAQLEELSLQYNYCDQILRAKLFWENDYSLDQEASDAIYSIVHLNQKLFSAIRVRNKADAQAALSDIMVLIGKNHSSEKIDLLRHELSETCLQIDQMLQADPHHMVSPSGYLHFQHIHNARSLNEIQQELEALIEEALDLNAILALKRNSDLIETAKKFICDNLTQNLSLDDISGAVYLSTNYFCGIFKVATGITVMDYVTQKKIELAKRLLLEYPDMLINTLSLQLGYNSVQSFIRQFKKVTSYTPDQFRKDILQSND